MYSPAIAMEREPADQTGTMDPDEHELRSFRMDRKSPEAAKLRTAVSQKLCEFLGNYSDEVLAEYIVVLVCNGKNQNQALDDLEAFLGHESQRFVSWLWDYLLNQVSVTRTPLNSADLEASVAYNPDLFDKDQKTSSPNNLQNQDFPPLKDDINKPSNFSSNSSHLNGVEVQEKFERWCPSNIPNGDVHAERSEAQACKVYNKLSVGFDVNEPKRDLRSTLSNSPETFTGGEQCRQYKSQHQKIIKSNSGAVPCEPSCMVSTSSVPRNFQLSAKENSHSRPHTARGAAPTSSFSDVRAVQEVTLPRPRGNVWDRLGKPCKGDEKMFSGKDYHFSHPDTKREIARNYIDEFRGSRAVLVQQDAKLHVDVSLAPFDNCSARIISENQSDIFGSRASNIQDSFDSLDKLERKRKYGDIDCEKSSASFSSSEGKHLEHERIILRKKGPLFIKHDSSENILFTEAPIPVSRLSMKSSSAEYRLQSHEIAQSRLNDKSVATTSCQDRVAASRLAKSEPTKNSTGNDKNKPMQEEIIDIKSKLHQVEMNMQKLRAKQANVNIKTNVSSDPRSHLDEDVNSRTVLVTNVHFAASREALISHFAKCGPIAKATILTDTITAQPKGAAFIVFVSKESVDKAISMSGISFFSRILTVIRKTEMPQGFLTPTKPAAKNLHPSSPQSCKGSLLRQHASPHLQWRRENTSSAENFLPAASDGSETLNSGK